MLEGNNTRYSMPELAVARTSLAEAVLEMKLVVGRNGCFQSIVNVSVVPSSYSHVAQHHPRFLSR